MQLLHKSKYFTIHQCDSKRCFLFDAGFKAVHLTCCQLLALRRKVNAIDLDAHFDSAQNASGIEILVFCNREHIIVLNSYELIDLKEFMAATFEKLESASFQEIHA